MDVDVTFTLLCIRFADSLLKQNSPLTHLPVSSRGEMTYYGGCNECSDLIVITLLGALSTLTTVLRFLARRLKGLSFMVDDFLILGANVSDYKRVLNYIPFVHTMMLIAEIGFSSQVCMLADIGLHVLSTCPKIECIHSFLTADLQWWYWAALGGM